MGKDVEKCRWKWHDVTMGVDEMRMEGKDMKTLKEFKDEQMKDSTFAKEYEDIQPEMDVIREIVEARISDN